MTKEDYLKFRAGQNFNIVHEFYKEKFDHSKHSPFLSLMELATFLPTFGNVNMIFEKFDVKILSDKNGNLIKSL